MRKARTVPLPNGVFAVKGGRYWYYQKRRGRPDHGPLIRLPKFGTPEFWLRLAEIERGDLSPATKSVDALIDAYKASPKWASLRPATQTSYAIALRYVSDRWGPLAANGLTATAVQAFMDQEFAERPGMGHLTLAVLRALFRYGVPRGWHAINPARDVEPPEGDPEGAEPWPEPAWQAIVAEAPPLLSRLAVLGRATGQRISDLVTMRPADRDGAGIKTAITKTQTAEHWCPLDQDMIRIIDGWGVFPAATYLSEDGRPVEPARVRRALRSWLRHRPDLGVDLTPHGLRCMAVCDRRIAGWPHQQISAAIGMSLKMVMHYSRAIDQRLAAGGERGRNGTLKTRGPSLQT